MSKFINKAMIEELKVLMENDFPLLIETFLTDGDQRLDALDKAILDTNPAKIREVAHALKGSSANLGAETLANISYEIESMGRENNLDSIDENITQLKEEYQKVKDYFQSLI